MSKKSESVGPILILNQEYAQAVGDMDYIVGPRFVARFAQVAQTIGITAVMLEDHTIQLHGKDRVVVFYPLEDGITDLYDFREGDPVRFQCDTEPLEALELLDDSTLRLRVPGSPFDFVVDPRMVYHTVL